MAAIYPNFDLRGQVAIVTGASKGIGYGLAKALAHTGVKVVATARNMKALEQLIEEIKADGGEATALAMDMRDVQQLQSVIKQAHEVYGRLDILVNNAGLGYNHDALEVTEADWDEMMAVNLKGLFFACQAAARLMLPRGYGRIINISSQAGVVGIAKHAVYSASKGGVNMLTKVLALEWSAKGVTVNAVAPTFIYTPGTAERLDNPEYRASVEARIPAGKVGTIADVAAAVMYLASPSASMVTGHILLVDGGWTAQ